MAISLPTTPSVGDEIVIDNQTYRYNGTGYVVVSEVSITKQSYNINDTIIIQDSEDNNSYKKLTVENLLENNITEW